jgi:hypothetical protein
VSARLGNVFWWGRKNESHLVSLKNCIGNLKTLDGRATLFLRRAYHCVLIFGNVAKGWFMDSILWIIAAVKHILRYIASTRTLGCFLGNGDEQLVSFGDTDILGLRVCSVREQSGTECHGSIPLEWVGSIVMFGWDQKV